MTPEPSPGLTLTISTCPACSCMFSCPFPCPRCGSDADSTITGRVLSRSESDTDSTVTGRVITPEDRQLYALEQTYPGYRIVRTRAGWFADRITPPTDAQRAVGVVGSHGRPDAVSLASALSHEHGILHQQGQG